MTGIPSRADEAYLQVLEGDEKAVLIQYTDVLRDDRHDAIHTVVTRPVDVRSLASWSMGLSATVTGPVDGAAVLNRRGDRIGVRDHAAWQGIANTFRAELENVAP